MHTDTDRANARIARAEAIHDLRRSGLLASEAATLVDAGGPVCSKCGEHVPQADVAAHVAAHVG